MTPNDLPYRWIGEMLQTSVGRPLQYEQGDTVYGVKTVHVENRASGGKLYTDPSRAASRYEELSAGESPLYKPEIHAVVAFRATVSTAGPSDMRDTMVVDPDEEELLTLTDIEILAFHDVGEPVPDDATLSL